MLNIHDFAGPCNRTLCAAAAAVCRSLTSFLSITRKMHAGRPEAGREGCPNSTTLQKLG